MRTQSSFPSDSGERGRAPPSVPAAPIAHHKARSRRVQRATPALVVGLALIGVWAVASTALAAFIDSTANPGGLVGADTLDPPSALTATASGSDVALDWTVTPDAWAEGYQIWRSTSPGCCYSLHDTVVGQGSTSYTDVGANSAAAPVFESFATASNKGTSIVISKPAGTWMATSSWRPTREKTTGLRSRRLPAGQRSSTP